MTEPVQFHSQQSPNEPIEDRGENTAPEQPTPSRRTTVSMDLAALSPRNSRSSDVSLSAQRGSPSPSDPAARAATSASPGARSSPVDQHSEQNEPTFLEAFAARCRGAAIPQLTSTALHMGLGTAAGAIGHTGAANAAARAAIASAIRVAIETAVHVGFTVATRTPAMTRIAGSTFGDVPKTEALERIALISGALSIGNGATLGAVYDALAAIAREGTPAPEDFAAGALAGVLSSSVLGASAYIYYNNDPTFKRRVDGLVQSVHTAARDYFGGANVAPSNQYDLERNMPGRTAS
ncbi:hypothetical protein KDW41_25000 [Burkholderia vietnamiensis]|nr:hypothetical protein [Burkholderia vietnamiensis]